MNTLRKRLFRHQMVEQASTIYCRVRQWAKKPLSSHFGRVHDGTGALFRVGVTILMVVALGASAERWAMAQPYAVSTNDDSIGGSRQSSTSVNSSGEIGSNGSNSSNKLRIGVGAEFLSAIIYDSVPKLSADIDLGTFQIVPTFGVSYSGAGNGAVQFALGGRFWFKLLSRAGVDLAVGGGLGISFSEATDNSTFFNFHGDGGSRIRAFLFRNLALDFTLGLGFAGGDSSAVFYVGPHIFGSGGFHFYF
ncbi:MAG: hypothetical protein KTR25_00770 [Myxococcales bacterium]|nr:hypothetical protein [Myxococcales bacterium]